MSTERIDAETLAAFLDGTLEPAERARVLRIIAEHPDEYEAFADAAHVTVALGADKVVPIRRTKRVQPWMVAVPALIAAGLAAVVIIPRFRGGATVSPIELAERLGVVPSQGRGSLAAKLGETWDQPGWSITRGGETQVDEPARAFRLGVRTTDVEIALKARDSAALPLVGAELVNLVSAIDGGAPLAAQYRAIVTAGPAAAADDRREAEGNLRALLGESVWFDLGAWAEAMRVAAMDGNSGFVTGSSGTIETFLTQLSARPAAETGDVLSLLVELRDAVRNSAGDRLDTVKLIMVRMMAMAGR